MCFFPVVGVIIGALVFGAGQLILRYTECGKLFFAAVMTMIPVAVTGGDSFGWVCGYDRCRQFL